jgi:hypothetical protein
MKKNDFQFPSEEVKLPSKGLLYPKDSPLSKGFIEMKYMTAKEEDILTNQNFIENGTVIDRLLESLIITDFDYNELLTGDKNALLVAARILGYGPDYDFMFRGQKISIDLSDIKDKELDESLVVEGKNEFDYELPVSKTPITFKFLTHKDEKAIEAEVKGYQKINKDISIEGSTRLKHLITSIDGNRDKKTIREFVDLKFLARDSRAFRKYIEEIQPSTDLTYDYEDRRGNITKIDIPVGIKFFWPDVTI